MHRSDVAQNFLSYLATFYEKKENCIQHHADGARAAADDRQDHADGARAAADDRQDHADGARAAADDRQHHADGARAAS